MNNNCKLKKENAYTHTHYFQTTYYGLHLIHHNIGVLGNDQQLVVVGYADDVIVMAEREEDLKRTTSKLIEEGEQIGLMVNEGKTKYAMVTRHNHVTRLLGVNNCNFERVAKLKYLGVDINENTDSHKEIRQRLIVVKKCYFGLVPLFKSKMLSWR